MTLSARTAIILLLLGCSAARPFSARAGAAAPGPVKVFILAGQSNMEGKALASTLEPVIADADTHDRFAHLKTDGKWTVRDDVWVTFLDRQTKGPAGDIPRYGPLGVGFGGFKTDRDDNNRKFAALSVGPELGIGYVLGDRFDEQVLLIKAAWGGRAVKKTFRPPSAMPSDEQIQEELAAIKAKDPETDMTFDGLKETYGSDYRKILSETRRVLDDVKRYFPEYDEERGYEITGFVWFQGWNDAIGAGNPDYPRQMAHFIRDIRRDLKAPDMPFVIGELGTDGPDAEGWIATFRAQQAEIAAMEEFRDNVRLAKTAHCWPTDLPDMQDEWNEFRANAQKNEAKAKDDPTRIDPGLFFQINWRQRYKEQLAYTSDKRYHYLGSGACYYEMGESMGRAMLEMMK
jgi:alpha-galactosidase